MKGKVEVVFQLRKNPGRLNVIEQVLVRKKGNKNPAGDISGALLLKFKYPIKNYSTFMSIMAAHGRLDELDHLRFDRNNYSDEIIFPAVEGDFFKSFRKKDGSLYHGVKLNLGTNDNPIPRTAYLDDSYEKLITENNYPLDTEFEFRDEVTEEKPDEEVAEESQVVTE